MKYKVEFTSGFSKEFKKLDRCTMLFIKAWIQNHLEDCENPRQYGKALKGNKSNSWQYRIGDYRLICDIQDGNLVILALSIAHRREAYDKRSNRLNN